MMTGSEGRYLIEIDGITSIEATEATPPSKDHSKVELHVGNRANPILLRGNFKCSDFSMKHAHSLNAAGDEFFKWLDDFVSGRNVERRSARFIVMDESGQFPAQIYEMQECVPSSFKPESH